METHVTNLLGRVLSPFLGEAGRELRQAMVTGLTILLVSLIIIFAGAHGSVRRPPSAKVTRHKHQDGHDEAATATPLTEPLLDQTPLIDRGLQASDAIILPVLATITLVVLYYLIHWLQDPELLNRALRLYMSMASIASVSVLFSHTLEALVGLVFVRYWRDWQTGQLWEVVDEGGPNRGRRMIGPDDGAAGPDLELTSPLPWFPNLAQGVSSTLWSLRRALRQTLVVFADAPTDPDRPGQQPGDPKAEMVVNGVNMTGIALAVVLAVAYQWTRSKTLSNIMAFGLCYGPFMWFSPTSFRIGTMVLWAYFVYDVVMVFMTPFMFDVAMALDVPVKVTFENELGQKNILGLGDILLPGLLICFTLRFDVWRYFQLQTRYVPIEEAPAADGDDGAATPPHVPPAAVAHFAHRRPTHRAIRPEWTSLIGNWGDLLWTGLLVGPAYPDNHLGRLPATLAAASKLDKTYFWASMAGYSAGLIMAFVAVVTHHGQPALLYLVPCVTASVWLTAWARGELALLQMYTEDGSLDTDDLIAEVQPEGEIFYRAIRRIKRQGVTDGRKRTTTAGREQVTVVEGDAAQHQTQAPFTGPPEFEVDIQQYSGGTYGIGIDSDTDEFSVSDMSESLPILVPAGGLDPEATLRRRSAREGTPGEETGAGH